MNSNLILIYFIEKIPWVKHKMYQEYTKKWNHSQFKL